MVFPDEAAHSEHCGSESGGKKPSGMRDEETLVCTLLSPRAQSVPQQLGMEVDSQHHGLLREVGCTDPYSWMGFTLRS